MANLSEDIKCAGSDTRPPMLDRTDFASWQQRIRLYCWGKENRVNILKSIDEGPFQMGTIRDTLVEGTEGAQQLGPERARVYSDLSPEDKDRLVTTLKLNRGLRDSNYDRLYDYLKQHEAHTNKNKMMLDRFTQHTIDPLALMSNVSHQQYYSQSSTTPPPTHATLPETALSTNDHKLRILQNKMLLMQAQENGVALDEEQLLFIAGGQDNVVDADVTEHRSHSTYHVHANLASAIPVYDKASPSYDSDILSEVPDRDNYQDAVCEHHEVHEMHDEVKPNYVVDSYADYTRI
ncbi:hypothetical protein Tco_0686738 [Tanacetum coccineum]